MIIILIIIDISYERKAGPFKLVTVCVRIRYIINERYLLFKRLKIVHYRNLTGGHVISLKEAPIIQ